MAADEEVTTGSPIVAVTRDDVVESAHEVRAVLVVDGRTHAIAGDPSAPTYPRSSLKPFQALAVLDLLGAAGRTIDSDQLAIACASHVGTDDHQIAAASLLAEAGLDEDALRCPAAWPDDEDVRSDLAEKTSLSHNCSGKHAAMLLAHTASGGDPASYLHGDAQVQVLGRDRIATACGETPTGPAVDGCGAPAWLMSLTGLARGFADLVSGATATTRAVADAMRQHPELVGGRALHDTQMMMASTSGTLVAKRGAEGVMGVGLVHPTAGPVGIAVKIVDGADRAAGPVAAVLVHALGEVMPTSLRRPDVMGGGRPRGAIEVPHSLGIAASAAVAGT